jgi:hypothetical protein
VTLQQDWAADVSGKPWQTAAGAATQPAVAPQLLAGIALGQPLGNPESLSEGVDLLMANDGHE